MERIDLGSRATRRETLKTATAFMILPAGLARGYAANEKANIGVIGLNRGRVDAQALDKLGQNIAALCEVDATILEKLGADYPKAKRYTDFRKMIENERLDGVVVATPDHSHAYISVWAMKHGLHVYCEKPLTQTVHEARVMARVAAQTKTITQMGTMSTTEERSLRTAELIQSGALGEITDIHLSTDRPIWPQGLDLPAGEDPVPQSLNWDLWLGPAPVRPYQAFWPKGHPIYTPEHKKRLHPYAYALYLKGQITAADIQSKEPEVSAYHPFVWRGWAEFGSGAIGDIAPHSMNVIFFALDLGAPSAVEVVATSGMAKEMYPEWTAVRWEWAQRGVKPPLKIHWYDGGKTVPKEITGDGRGGMTWIGTKGSLPQGRGPFLGQKTKPYDVPAPRDWGRQDVYKDWIAGFQTGKPPSCGFGYSGPFTEAYQLANIALRVGHRIEWDARAFRITNSREANRYLRREEYRRGWDLKEIAGSAYNV